MVVGARWAGLSPCGWRGEGLIVSAITLTMNLGRNLKRELMGTFQFKYQQSFFSKLNNSPYKSKESKLPNNRGF